MTKLLQAELFKLNRNKTFYVIILTIIGISTLVHYLRVTDWWYMSGTAFDRAGLHELNGLAAFTIPLYFNFIISTLAGFFIANEFSSTGVIKNQIISGKQRTHIFMAKFIIFSLGSIFVTVIIPIIIGLVLVFLFGQADILTGANLMYLGRAFSLFILQFLSFIGVVLWIAIKTEDSGKTIMFTFLLSFVIFAIEKLVPASFIKTVYEYTFFYQFTVVFDYTMTAPELVLSVVIGIISLAVVLLVNIYSFNKKEIH